MFKKDFWQIFAKNKMPIGKANLNECQLDNILSQKSRRRYNVITQVIALKSHLISPVCYKYLRILPHPKHCKNYSNFGFENYFSAFLMQATSQFIEKETLFFKWMRYMLRIPPKVGTVNRNVNFVNPLTKKLTLLTVNPLIR